MKYYNGMGQDITETVSNQFNELNLTLQDCQETVSTLRDELTSLALRNRNLDPAQRILRARAQIASMLLREYLE